MKAKVDFKQVLEEVEIGTIIKSGNLIGIVLSLADVTFRVMLLNPSSIGCQQEWLLTNCHIYKGKIILEQ